MGSGAGLPWSRRSPPQLAWAAALSPRMGGQSQAALAASDLEPQRPETGGTWTQNPELEAPDSCGREPPPDTRAPPAPPAPAPGSWPARLPRPSPLLARRRGGPDPGSDAWVCREEP